MDEAYKAAFIAAQTQMMIAERMIMEAENAERDQRGLALAHGPEQWNEFHDSWASVLGYSALIEFWKS